MRLLQEAYRQGVLGHHRDMRLLYRSWGFAFDRIISPVYLWHGEHDAQISLDAAQAMVDLIPKCELRVVRGAGHLVLAYSSISVDILKQAIRSK